MSHEVFVSYATEDGVVAASLIASLEAAGVGCWFAPRDIPPPRNYAEAIIDAIDAARAMVLVLSSHAVASQHVVREIERGINRNLPVVTFRIQDVAPGKALEYFVSISQWVDAASGPTGARLPELVSATCRCIGREPEPLASNPFTWRGRITDPKAVFDRDNETRFLGSFLRNRQNCQIVGPKRIGKSTLLARMEAEAGKWAPGAAVANLDLFDRRRMSPAGLLGAAGKAFGADPPPGTAEEFCDCVDAALSRGARLVLCLDEFEELARRKDVFPRDFFVTLRYCAGRGLSIITTSRRPLDKLTDPGDETSSFYNVFATLQLGKFSAAAAEHFVAAPRRGVAAFSPDETRAILDFAGGHPLALQVACYHVVEARERRETFAAGLQRAADDMRGYIPQW